MLPERAFRVNFFAAAGRFSLVLLALGTCTGCASAGLRDGRFQKSGVAYRVDAPPPGFESVSLRGNDLAYVSKDSGHAFAVNSTCEGYDDAPLSVLTHHLLMGFTEVQQLEQNLQMLEGRESLRSHYLAKLDGVPVELGFVVLKKSGCIFDIEYQAPQGRYPEHLSAFEHLVENFRIELPR